MVVPILFQFGCTKPVPSWLYQTCSIGSMRGQKRPLLLPWVKSYTHEGDHSLIHGSSSIPRWSLYLCHSCQLDPKSGSTRPWNFRTKRFSMWGKKNYESLTPLVLLRAWRHWLTACKSSTLETGLPTLPWPGRLILWMVLLWGFFFNLRVFIKE